MNSILKRKFWIYLFPLLLLHAEKKENFDARSIRNPFLRIPGIETVEIEYPKFPYHPLKEFYSQKKYKEILSHVSKLGPSKSWPEMYVVAMSHFRLRQYSKVVPLVDSLLDTLKKEGSKEAKASFFQLSVIEDWLLYVLGTSHHFLGNLEKSNGSFRLFRKKVIQNLDYTALFPKALQMETQNYIALKQYSTLLREFSGLSFSMQKNRSNTSSFRRVSSEEIEQRIHYSMALAYEGLGKIEFAKKSYEKAIGGKSVAYTRKAVKNLLSLTKEKELKPETQLKLAQYLYQQAGKKTKTSKRKRVKNQDYIRILSLLGDFERNPESSKLGLESQILLAQSYAQLGKTQKAHSLYKAILKPGKGNFLALRQKAQFLQAVLLKQSDPKKAYESFQKIIQNTENPYLGKSCKEILEFLTEAKNSKIDFLKTHYIPNCLSEGRLEEVDRVLFHWIFEKKYSEFSFLFSDFHSSDFDFSDSHSRSKIPMSYRAKVLFWLGEVSLKNGEKSKAQEYFKELFLSYKESYYTFKALQRLKTLLSKKELKDIQLEDQQRTHRFLNSKEFQEKFAQVLQKYDFEKDSNFLLRKALVFLELGEIAEGYEVFLSFLESSKDSKRNYRMKYSLVFSKLFHKMGLYAYSIRYADFLNQYLNGAGSRNDTVPGLERWRYPLYYKEEVFSWAEKKGVDAYLIFALIREESRFLASAISRSGAMGLMQLMPKTAQYLMKQVGMSVKEDVYEPNINIHLGVHYLKHLLNRDTVSLALAGYNGGPTRIRRIFKRFSKELLNTEHFVELIPIDETRNYVKKVLKSYYNYKQIYEKP